MNSIPVKNLINVIPAVLAAGSADLAMNAVFLTQDTSIPIGTLQSFPSAQAVSNWFGATAQESALANIYFSGFAGGTQLPSALYFAQYNTAAVAGYLRGGALTGVTLAALQALSGTITITIDGVSHTSANINLATATSFSNAAELIQAGIQGGAPSSTATCTYDSLRNAFVITSGTTGATSSVGFATAGTLATGLLLTQATGAVQSAGAAAATPAGAMNAIVGQSQDWATFMTVFDPDNGAAGGPIKQQFSNWVAAQNDGYAYVAWDSDPAPAAGADPACFAQAVKALDGTIPVWGADGSIAAFICGITASIGWNAVGGRTAYHYRSSPAVTPNVTDETTASNLETNGYNYYGGYATRSASFQWLQPGKMTGNWEWIDAYVDQIYWNARFQAALAELVTNVKSIPYTEAGYTLIRQALAPEIRAMGSFGAWVAGVALSGSQQVAVNTAAGIQIANTLQSQGWYLQVLDPGATARQNRQSPDCTFWYTDGGSVRQINLSSIDVE